MKVQSTLLLLVLFILASVSLVSGENQTVLNNSTIVNQTEEAVVYELSPQESLMNHAFMAREFALENEKNVVLAEFSNPSGRFNRDGMVITAYDNNGILLADSTGSGNIGSRYIRDDHDSGQIRLMRDIAAIGGGLYVDSATGKNWFVLDIDGSWWICTGINQNA